MSSCKTAPKVSAREYMPEGALLVSSWGYEQTNINFYEVTRATESMVTVRPIGQTRTYTGWAQYEASPKPGKYIGEPMRRKIQNYSYNPSPYIMISNYEYAYIWDGTPKEGTSWY